MAKKKQVKVLYFVTGPVANDEQQAEIDAMPGLVCVRNAAVIHDDDPLEDFDHVAGDVPTQYAKAAAEKAAKAEDAPDSPKASPDAPAAPQQALTGKEAKPGASAPASAWKPN